MDEYFVNEVWAKVGAHTCLKCHTSDGEALESKFILKDPERSVGKEKDEALRHNREAFDKTLATGHVTFFSRSRQKLWTKGESSGHFLVLKSISTDCDVSMSNAMVTIAGLSELSRA